MPIQRTKRKMKARSKIEKCVWMFLLLCWYFNDIRETSLGYNWQAMLLCRLFFFLIVPSPQKNRDALLSIRLSGSPCVAWWLSAWLSLSFLQWRKEENEMFNWWNAFQMGKWDTTFLLSKDFLPHFTRLAFGTPADPPKNRGGIRAKMEERTKQWIATSPFCCSHFSCVSKFAMCVFFSSFFSFQ